MILFLNLCTIYLHTNTLKNSHYRRIREKYEMEMRDLERSEQQALEKYNEMKARSYILSYLNKFGMVIVFPLKCS